MGSLYICGKNSTIFIVLIFLKVGNILYIFTLKNTTENLAFNDISLLLAWITLGISLFHIIFPMELLNKKLFPVEDLVTETQTFEQARIEFSTVMLIEKLY